MTVVWALVDDLPGHKSQCLGVAEALGLGFEAQRLEYRGRAGLPNVLLGATFGGLTSASRGELGPPWPDLVIAAGRRTAPVARAIKKASGGAAKLVQLMFPGNDGTDEFDLIAAPRPRQPAHTAQPVQDHRRPPLDHPGAPRRRGGCLARTLPGPAPPQDRPAGRRQHPAQDLHRGHGP
jgi:mitochondrial fission protein ELM1